MLNQHFLILGIMRRYSAILESTIYNRKHWDETRNLELIATKNICVFIMFNEQLNLKQIFLNNIIPQQYYYNLS